MASYALKLADGRDKLLHRSMVFRTLANISSLHRAIASICSSRICASMREGAH
jgi:hypothetical protein